MISAPVIAALASTLATASASMSFGAFNEKVAWACFNGTVGGHRQPVLARSMPQFLELVRRVEDAHRDTDAVDIAVLLLRRFSIDFVDHQRLADGERFVVDAARERRAAIFDAMLRSAPAAPFDEASLSVAAKCAMFSMLSHALNSGSRREGQSLLRSQEQGVVSVGADRAVSMGHVLRGVAASKYSRRDSAVELLRTLQPDGDMAEGHLVVDPVYGPTLAGALGTASSWATSKAPSIGGRGIWTTATCPRSYALPEDVGKVTDAELVGALDGFILATTMKRIAQGHRLSRVLDMYYSPRGIRELLPQFPTGLSFCARKGAIKRLLSAERLQEQVLVMARLYSKLDGVDMKPTAVKSAIIPTLKSFHARMDNLLKPPEWCPEDSEADPTCTTKSDVLIVLDPIPGNSIYDNYQRTLAGYVAEDVLRANPGSRVSITAAELSEDARRLTLLYSSRGTTYSSPACAIETLKSGGCTECTEVDIWRAVNGTWNALGSGTEELTASKVVIYFKFSAFRASAEDVRAVIQELRRVHSDMTAMAVGPRADILRDFHRDPKDAVIIIPNSPEDGLLLQVARELSQEICQVPAVLRCHGCEGGHRDRVSGAVTEFQTPLTSKHWAVFPKDFGGAPHGVNITFETHHLPVRICFERHNSSFQRSPAREDICRESGGNAKAIQFGFKNICTSQRPDTCQSLYFTSTVLLRKPGEAFLECTETGCRYPDQTKLVVSYEVAFTSEAGTSAEQPKANLDSPSVFHELVGSKCFRQPKEAAEDDFHLAPSLDVFLSLVRRVERAHDGSDLFDVAELLLHRFSLDHFEPAEMLRPREDVELKRTLLKTLLYPRSKRVPLAFDEDVLTTREKCALFLMLSHSLQGGSTNGSCRLETGVVSIDWQTDTLAVSVGKVLRGIVAARAARTVNVTELFLEAWPRRDLAGLDPSLVVRSDFAATVGSLLSVAAVETSLRANGGSAIGAEGSWTDPGCPSFYTVRSPQGTCTYALLRGAIDGYVLGKHAHELANSGAALSEVLAGYYGGGGVPGAPHLSVCRRRELLRPYVLDGHLGEQVETLVEAYAFLLNERNAGRAKAAAARVTAQLLRRMRMDLLRNPRFCDLYPLTPESARCSTPADVHVVLDADASRNVTWMEQQRHVIRYLANFLQLSEGGNRRLHLYVNKKDIDGDIQQLLRNVTLPSTIACYVNALKLSELAADDEASTLESLQRRLLQDARPLENATVMPSQTVVYFKFGNLRAPVRKLKPIAARLLQVPEGALFAVGNDGDVLRSLSRQDIRTTVVLEPDRDGAERAARRIAGAACGVPASFQCLEYGTATTFEGDVAENAIIYGVLRPESCPQFAHGQLTVRAANGMVRFCKGGTENCDDVSDQGRSYRTPCKDGVCEPLQFALIGIAEAREEGGRPTGMVHYRIRYNAPLNATSTPQD